ncbi:MAG: hypothetical protein OCD76_03385 [Reichenbachiella sp.]
MTQRQAHDAVAELRAHQPYKEIKDLRYYLVGKIGHFSGTILHILFIPLFYFLGVYELVAFNIVSLAIFTAIYFTNKRENYLLSTTLGVFEIISHQSLCVYFIGWETGFQYYIITLLMVPFLTYPTHRLTKFTLAGLCIITYLTLQATLKDATPIYSINPTLVETLCFLNTLCSMLLIVAWSFYFNDSVGKADDALEAEQKQSDDLLHNILPSSIAARLKQESTTIADGYKSVSVLFLDIVGFSQLSATQSPIGLVTLLNTIFSKFDDLAIKYDLEKIKTIGDAYMVAAGVPEQKQDDAIRLALFSLELLEQIDRFNTETNNNVTVRVGMNSGPVIAGVIGKRKFIYDLWGDAVNVASRMESHGTNGEIHVSETTYNELKDTFDFEKCSPIDIKGKGLMQTYFLRSVLA